MNNNKLLSNLILGQLVRWNDPDNGECSGLYRVTSTSRPDDGEGDVASDTTVWLRGLAGSEVQTTLAELSEPLDADLTEMLASSLGRIVDLIKFGETDGRALQGDNQVEWDNIRPFAEEALRQHVAKAQRDAQAQADRKAVDTILAGVEHVIVVEKHWSGSDLQFAVQELGVWVLEAGSLDYNGAVAGILAEGIACAQSVLDSWASNKLADAVTHLVEWQSTAIDQVDNLGLLPADTAVVIEVSGGNVNGVSARGDVAVYVVDYDNGEDNESEPEIPDSNGRASIQLKHGGKADSAFVTKVACTERAFYE